MAIRQSSATIHQTVQGNLKIKPEFVQGDVCALHNFKTRAAREFSSNYWFLQAAALVS
jgi:hypothetical protein